MKKNRTLPVKLDRHESYIYADFKAKSDLIKKYRKEYLKILWKYMKEMGYDKKRHTWEEEPRKFKPN